MTLNSVSFGDITIAGQQAQPPAGHDDIAFRPSCGQVTATLQANGQVAHAINLPDGQTRILAEYDNMPVDKAHLYLDAEGLCKTGPDAIEVPIIYTTQVPEQAVAQATAIPTESGAVTGTETGVGTTTASPAGGGLGMMLVGAVALAVIGGGFVWLTQRKPVRKESSQSVKADDSSIADTPPAAASNNRVNDLTQW
ncbi:MAG: hypothetical protein AAF808_19025 [Cyanobacteria bacterium P01_D01_bin.2]